MTLALNVTCQVERFADALPDIIPLVDPHWAEVGSFAVEFDREIDYTAYANLDREGRLLTVMMRADEQCIGYFIGVTGLDLHRVKKSSARQRVKVLSALVYYVAPDRRGYAPRLVRTVERAAVDRGAQILNIRVKPGLNEAEAFFGKLGYVEVERTMTRLIGGAAHAGARPTVA